MIQISATKLGIGLLNSIVCMDDIPMEVIDRIYNALILIDPQPEENGSTFFAALRYAGEKLAIDADRLQTFIDRFEEV